MSEKAEEYSKITRALKDLGLEDKYLHSFQEQGVGDCAVKICLDGRLNSDLDKIISSKEEQQLFKEAFEKACEYDEKSGHLRTQTAQEEQGGRPVAGGNEKKVWKEIAQLHGLDVTTEFGVKKKLQAKALEVQKQVYEEAYEIATTEAERQIRAGAAAASKFLSEALAPVEAKIRDAELEKLNRALGSQEEALKRDYNVKVATARKLLEEDMDDIFSNYELHMKRELCGDVNVDKEEYKEVHEQVAEELLEAFKQRSGNNPFFCEQDFKIRLALQLAGYLEQLEQSNKDLRRKTVELTANLTKMYHQHLEKVTHLSEFNACHQDTVRFLESYAMNYKDLDEENRIVSWYTFKATLDDSESEAKAEVGTRALKLEEEARAAAEHEKQIAKLEEEQAEAKLEERAPKILEELVAFYRTTTEPIFTQTVSLEKAEAAFLNQHRDIKDEVLKKLAAQLLPHGTPKTSFEQAKLDQTSYELENGLDLIMSQTLEETRVRWAAFLKSVEALNEGFVDQYMTEMNTFAENARSENELERREGKVRHALLKKFQAKLSNIVGDRDYLIAAIAELEEMLESEKCGLFEVFRGLKKDSKLLYKAAMAEAKKYYIEEIDGLFYSREWWDEAELREVHNQVLDGALESSKEYVDLSETAEQNLRRGFEVILKGYMEKNMLRTPNLEPAIGIDLGTTYSCVGVYYNGGVQIIPNLKFDGKTTVASYVAFNEGGRICVGNEAKESAFHNPINTIFDAKRLIGRKFDDPKVQQDMRLWPFQVIDVDNEPRVKVKNQTFRPEEISAKILAYLKSMAETHLKRPVRKAVITVPAYFKDSQRKATKDAAEIAGLEATIINEPTAAALAYKLDRTGDAEKNVLVFDLGGGTFDVVLISYDFGEVVVKAVNGDTHLGGEDFDNAIVDALVERVKKKFNIDLTRGHNSTEPAEKHAACTRLRRLKSACEEQKRLLSETKKVDIRIDLLDGDFSLNETFTRDEFNAINATRFQRCIQVVEETLKQANLSKTEVDDVVLVGGSTRIPKVQQLLKEFFGEKQSLCRRINADEAVAYGAAFQAALKQGDQVQGNSKNMIVKDATPYSLGIEVLSKQLSVILAKNTPIPCSETERYVTSFDNQTRVCIDVFEGERRVARDNNLLGTFYLNNIPPNPAGQERITCTMTIDSEGILHVEAVSVSQGTMEKIIIQEHRGRMSSDEKEVAKAKPMFIWK